MCVSRTLALAYVVMYSGIAIAQGISNKSQEYPDATPLPRGIVTDLAMEIAINETPKLDVPFEVFLTVKCKGNLESMEFGPDYTISFSGKGAEVIGRRDHEIHGYLKKGDIRHFSTTMIISHQVEEILIGGKVIVANFPAQGIGIELFLIDEKNGLYGSREQWLQRRIGVLGQYNNIEPEWLDVPDPAWVESNRLIAENMRKFEPTLTDSEALCLHWDNYVLIIHGIGDSGAPDSERIVHMLQAGWLEAQRSSLEQKKNWFANFMEKNP